MLRRVAVVRTDVSEELSVSIIRVKNHRTKKNAVRALLGLVLISNGIGQEDIGKALTIS
jgi:hypothetical protein